MRRLVVGSLATSATALILIAGIFQAGAVAPGNQYFQRSWARTDQPVASGQANRTWMWGPDGFTGEVQEPYSESPGGQRTVQYFDKARMEISQPGSGDPNSIWYVTNGLLVVELITGRMQVGDTSFNQGQPATVNVAGDADDSTGPTYATFKAVLNAATARAIGTPGAPLCNLPVKSTESEQLARHRTGLTTPWDRPILVRSRSTLLPRHSGAS